MIYLKQFSIFTSANILTWGVFTIVFSTSIYFVINDLLILLEWTLSIPSATPITLTLILDQTGLIFSAVVLFISANVLSFSKLYMCDDKFQNRFTILVLLFVLSINLLIYLPHFMMLLLGWDGLGLVSFILVMYYQNPSSLAAAILTALTNRIGDVAILLAIALTLNQGHWIILEMWNQSWVPAQVMLITLAAMTKSAQMPFSRWLPAAIAAPTPVSALVHSSTLVTAGVFLLIRFYPFLHIFEYFNPFIVFIATSTTFIAGLRANNECDFKKIVALSTLSQLGVMIYGIGINIPWVAFFHIITHALFKALLFICVGSFIHFHSHSQDLRWMGNITSQIPFIVSCLIVSNLALCGFPFLAGFYSKDMVIDLAHHAPICETLVLINLFRLGLTSYYSTRAISVGVCSPKQITPFISISEPKSIIWPAGLLSFIAITIGAILRWLYPIFTHINSICQLGKVVPLIAIISGFYMGWMISTSSNETIAPPIKYTIIHYASTIIWFLVPLSTQIILKTPMWLAHHNLKSIDQGWTENLSSQGYFNTFRYLSNKALYTSPNEPHMLTQSAIVISITFIALFYCFNSLNKAFHWSWKDEILLKHVCMV